MIISAPTDYREAARRKLPRYLFDYIDGGANAEVTLRKNVDDLAHIALRQRVLRNVADLSLETELLGEKLALPIALGPVGISGMYARRGEVQAAQAAASVGIPYTLSTVSICSMEEVQGRCDRPIWFQLYVLKDRGFVRNALVRAQEAGISTLVVTVDLPLPGSRYRDRHSGMSGPAAPLRRAGQALFKPAWAFDVGLLGRPHDLGNVSVYRGRKTSLNDYIGWIASNFDPSIGWKDLEWIRDAWKGKLVIKGILDPEDARDAVRFGADGVVVSNHGGRQLDGVLSTVHALPGIADAVGGDLTVLVDSGIRSGLDIVRMLSLGARGVLLGRAYIYALAADGRNGVRNLLDLMATEMRVAMTLCGARSVSELTRDNLVSEASRFSSWGRS
ncbi:FMN-dependent L-lactate dehydrogenase LldD [Dyella humicola]|uniref:FMN-dependent L-lactate dehydrogenase LldD n=1 Tax=Dyella humicola TaxID=2992126 RepID=UPI002254EB57|nr:FMN-dependent L-lactate dehydrogenase LldD [Dyella humicola]